jgi:type 1 glutamine amidotransferase
VLGGRFHYQPGSLHGTEFPDSGYRFDVTQEIQVVDANHPICSGIPKSFSITDEAYLYPVLEKSVTPILCSDFDFENYSNFYSAGLAMRGQMNSNVSWTHPKGSNLVAWVRKEKSSPIAYIQLGDGPSAYTDSNFRKLVNNAIDWVSSEEARNWVSS